MLIRKVAVGFAATADIGMQYTCSIETTVTLLAKCDIELKTAL